MCTYRDISPRLSRVLVDNEPARTTERYERLLDTHPVPPGDRAGRGTVASRFVKIPEACHSSFREPVARLSLHPLSPTHPTFLLHHPPLSSVLYTNECVYVQVLHVYTSVAATFRLLDPCWSGGEEGKRVRPGQKGRKDGMYAVLC